MRPALAHRPIEHIACVDLPELAMQLLLRDHPTWQRSPVAVSDGTRPQSRILVVNAIARRAGVRPGMRYGAARNLVADLRAAAVPRERLDALVGELATALTTFSPRVEPSRLTPGVFWLDPDGLGQIYGSLRAWTHSVHEYLKGRGFRACVVAGFGRYRTHAIARTRFGAIVLPNVAREVELAGGVELARLDLSSELRDSLEKLSIRTLADVARLPATELETRFGPEARALHDEAVEAAHVPVQRRVAAEPFTASVAVDPPDADLARLLFGVKGALHSLVAKLSRRGLSLAALEIELSLEHGEPHVERIEPAQPTRDEMVVLDLVRLRLGTLALSGPVDSIELRAETIRPASDQLSLFDLPPRRDPRAGARALARLRAAHGEGAVTRAKLEPAHLPEAQFRWEPVNEVKLPSVVAPREGEAPPLVRHVLPKARALPSGPGAPGSSPDLGPEHGPILRLFGPYRTSGGWWQRTVERDYYYAETERGDLLWLYFDRARHRWYLHGIVD